MNMSLPICNYDKDIVDAVMAHRVTIITAETGSGKSTQVPQFLYKHFDNVVVTEPRIMAAKTLASRVSSEMNQEVGTLVGYATGYDKCYSKDTKIRYCTDGLQLIKTIFAENTSENNVLIIDEIHEWNLNIEVLVAWCKHMLDKWNTKIVLMSATMDSSALAEYFGDDVTSLNIPGKCYDVSYTENDDWEFIPTIAENVEQGHNVLVFVPGKKEISETIKKLTEQGVTACMLPLHGEMNWEDQQKAFETYPTGKVVVSTNVAQTSITIPDIDVVVDSGTARITIAEDGIQGLYLKNISQADILQRKGRAGRTKPGKYYLCSSVPMSERAEYTIPEIQRSILSRVVLQLAAIGIDAESLKFFHQPRIAEIVSAKKQLIAIGAMTEDYEVTDIGYQIVKIPVSVELARMIIEAKKYKVVKPVLTIAAIVEMGGLLDKEGSYSDFSKERDSDLLAELDVWNQLQKMERIDFRQLGINKKRYFRIKDHINKLYDVLYGIISAEKNREYNRKNILKSCITGWAGNIFISQNWRNNVEGADGITRVLSKNTCVGYSDIQSIFFIGLPTTIEYQTQWGSTAQLELLCFVSIIEKDDVLALASKEIKETKRLEYSPTDDAVVVVREKVFRGYTLDTQKHVEKEHPEYYVLKAQYEAQLEELKRTDPYWQTELKVGDRVFKVSYERSWGASNKKAYITVDEEALFTIEEKCLFLENYSRVWIRFEWDERDNIPSLRSCVEQKKLINLKRKVSSKRVTLDSIVGNMEYIKPIDLHDGFGTPFYAYGCLILQGSSVFVDVVQDQELAEANTKEALQYLFKTEIENRYPLKKFSHQEGKKKKVLTKAESDVKSEFDDMVRYCLMSLTIDNIDECLDFLEEYYKELLPEKCES